MRDVLLVRYGEVFLKGANRPYFLKVLVANVRKAVHAIGGHVWMSDSPSMFPISTTCRSALSASPRFSASIPSAPLWRWRRISRPSLPSAAR